MAGQPGPSQWQSAVHRVYTRAEEPVSAVVHVPGPPQAELTNGKLETLGAVRRVAVHARASRLAGVICIDVGAQRRHFDDLLDK